MEDISFYFQPIETSELGNYLVKHENVHDKNGFPEMKTDSVALFYVPEFRNSNYKISIGEKFRTEFYQLNTQSNWNKEIYDLGDILPGEKVEDTYYAVAKVFSTLLKSNILPIIIGGSQDLTMAMFDGYKDLEQLVNICSVDHSFNLGDPDSPVSDNGYVSQLLMKRPSYLFNFSTIGIQAPLVKKEEFDLTDKLYFDYCRLGEFNMDFKKAEPHLRNSDLLTVDLNSIRFSELQNDGYSQPNGFYADQICQISKYAGVSDKITSFGVFNYFPEKSSSSNVSKLVAQIIWYFIDGLHQRVGDFPIGSKRDYFKFSVHLDDFKEELIFYKSNKSSRWWLEVPYPASEGKKYERHHLIPCDQMDYDKAMQNEIPDLWWKTYQKLV